MDDDGLRELEVRELTDLLRHDSSFADLRLALMGRTVDPKTAVLAGLISSEDEDDYGVIITRDAHGIVFELDRAGHFRRFEPLTDVARVESDFTAVATAIEMVAKGMLE